MTTYSTTSYLNTEAIELELICEFEFEAASGDGYHEERFPSTMTLTSAKVGTVELFPALTRRQIGELEDQAMTRAQEDARRVF